MLTLNINDIDLHVIDRGRGPVLLFVHGFPLDHSMWQAQLDEFSKTHRVIAPDLRGFGRSAVTAGTVRMEMFAGDLSALLDKLRIDEPIVYCGLSMGGYIGWEFVRRHTSRVGALVLCDTRSASDTPAAAAARLQLAATVLEKGSAAAVATMLPKLLAQRTRENRPEIAESLKAVIAATHPEAIAAALRGMAERPDSTPMLSGIRQPALVIVGREDALTPVKEMRALAERMPAARFVEIADAGHMAPLENPEAVNAAIREFLAAVPAD
jgi:pimeloyl-ACP methyl ester carboxylesterase